MNSPTDILETPAAPEGAATDQVGRDDAPHHHDGHPPGTRKAPDWNVGREGDGRILVVNASVQPRHRSREGARALVDVSPLRGRTIGLKASAIASIIGLDKAAVRFLIERRVLRRHPATNAVAGPFYRFDPAWSLLDLHRAYVADILVKPRTHADFAAYKAIHSVCRIGAGNPVPPIVREAALEKLTELGSTAKCEINAFIPLGDDEHGQCQEIRRDLNEYWRLRAGGSPDELDEAVVRAQLPEFADVPRTHLAKTGGSEWPEPPGEALARVWCLGPLRLPAMLLLYVFAATKPQREQMSNLVRALEVADEVFRQVAPDGSFADPNAMEAALGHLAFGSLDNRVTPYEREYHVRLLLVALRLLNRWIHHTGGTRFAAFATGEVDAADFRRALAETYGHLREKAKAKRLERAGKAADRLVMLQEIAYLRKEGIADTSSIARRAIASMGDAPCVKFSTLDRVMSFDGTLLPGAQRNDWVVWRRPARGDDLPDLPDDPAAYVAPAIADAAVADGASVLDAPPIDLGGYIFEYLGCEAVVGEEAFDPFFVTIFECGAPMAPAALDPEMQGHRHRLIVDGKLPDYPSTPEGLLRYGAEDAALFRRTARRGRTIVPLFQMEMAMRFAHLALRAIVESYCRSGEFRQMQHSRSRWPKESGKGLARVSFTAFGKVTGRKGKPSEPTSYRVSEQTHDEAFDLAELVILFCHRDEGQLPDVPAPTRFDWKCEPGAYIFSWMGKALRLAPLLVFLRYLLGGTGERHDFHDFRHAASKEANACGLPMIEIQEALKHSHPSMTAYYASMTAQQIARRTEDDLARRRAYLARREAKRAARRAAANDDERRAA